jgi:hypothetical protein
MYGNCPSIGRSGKRSSTGECAEEDFFTMDINDNAAIKSDK